MLQSTAVLIPLCSFLLPDSNIQFYVLVLSPRQSPNLLHCNHTHCRGPLCVCLPQNGTKAKKRLISYTMGRLLLASVAKNLLHDTGVIAKAFTQVTLLANALQWLIQEQVFGQVMANTSSLRAVQAVWFIVWKIWHEYEMFQLGSCSPPNGFKMP